MNQGTASMHRQKKRKGSQVDRSSSADKDARRFSVQLSSPTEGRPACFWAHGSIPDRIIEFWPDKEQMGRAHRYSFDVIRKYVVYDRTRPDIRAVLLVDKAREKGGGIINAILGRRLEWDGPQGKAEIKKALGLVDEIARIERRGRPHGTCHPKRKPSYADVDIQFYDRLKEAKCTAMEIKTWFLFWEHRFQVKAAKELRISPQLFNKRIKLVESKVQKRFPDFSLRNLKQLSEMLRS
jgi:hypothetical protein